MSSNTPEFAANQKPEQIARHRKARYLVWLALLLILLAAFAIRAYGSNFGLPYLYHPDEPAIMDAALRIEARGDPNPHWFNYPSLYIYVQLFSITIVRPLARLWASWRGLTTDPLYWQHAIYQVGRVITALLATATVAVVYATGKRLFNWRVGLWAALLLAGLGMHILHAHYITADVPSAFFSACCLYFAARALEKGSLLHLTLSALMAGLAAGTKYNAGLVLVTTGLAFLLSCRDADDLISPAWLLIPLGAAVGFFGSTPYALLDYDAFNEGLQAELEHYRTGHQGAEGSDNWRWYGLYLYREGMFPPLAWASALGALWTFVRRTRKDILLILFPILYYGLLAMQRVRFARNLMPLLPFLVILAARLISEILDWLSARVPWSRLPRAVGIAVKGLAILGIAVGLLHAPVRQQIEINYWLTQPDTRTIAKQWIEENITTGSKIAVEAYTPDVEHSWMPGQTRSRYQVERVWKLPDRPLSYYQEKGFQYIIASSNMYSRYFVDRTSYPQERQFYEELFSRWVLVKEFKGHSAPTHDPVIRIYRAK